MQAVHVATPPMAWRRIQTGYSCALAPDNRVSETVARSTGECRSLLSRFSAARAWTKAIALAGSLAAAAGLFGCGEDETTAPIPPVTVTDVSPASGPLAGGTRVTITGTNLSDVTSVTIGGRDLLATTVRSSTRITGITPVATSHGAADVVVTCRNHEPGTCSGCFTYNPLPTVTAVSPDSGPLTGGTHVTITGTNFVDVTSVTIGGTELGERAVVSTTQITGTTPAGGIPQLLSPAEGEIMDNGCQGTSDAEVWDFDWTDVGSTFQSTDVVVTSSTHGAGTCADCFTYLPHDGEIDYHLFVIGPTAIYPVIDHTVAESSYHRVSYGYIVNRNTHGWRWKVRARIDGEWMPWSPERTFDVEPLDTDCP